MSFIEFIVPGEPVGKGRPRFTAKGRTYTPEKTADYERLVRLYYSAEIRKRPGKKLLPPYTIMIRAYHKPPKSWSKKRRAASVGQPWIGIPDADNIGKIILDALQGNCFSNDSAVTMLVIAKKYDYTPRVEVTIYGTDG